MRSLSCVSVVVCVVCKLRPCPSYSMRRDRITLGLWRSLHKGGGGYSMAYVDCATLHKYMAKTMMLGWGISPLQCVEDEWCASVREWHWWWIFQRRACNEVPRGTSTQGCLCLAEDRTASSHTFTQSSWAEQFGKR